MKRIMYRSCTQKNAEQQERLLKTDIMAENINQVLAAVPAGVCQFVPGEELLVVAANRSFLKIMGYSDTEIQNGNLQDVFANLLEDERKFLHEKIAEILRSSENEGEYELTTVDINNNPLTVNIRYFYDREGSGNITINIIDITDRKRMEEELHIREEDYRTAIEVSDYLYFNYDAATKTCTHLFDSEKLFGISQKMDNIPESLIALGLCAPESLDDYRGVFKMFAEGIPHGDFHLHLQNIKTHEFRWYGGGFRTVFDAKGKPLHAIAAFKDITDQREKEIAYNIHRQQIEAHKDTEIIYFEINLTTGMCDYHYGVEAKKILEICSSTWKDMVACAIERLASPSERQGLSDFLCSSHLLDLYERGIVEAKHEYRGYGLNNGICWQRASVNIASDQKTREVKVYCTIEDIEDEKAAKLESVLEQKRSRYYQDAYDKLSSSVMYGVCKYSTDDDLSIVFANDIFYKLHGFASAEAAVAAGFTSVLFPVPKFGINMVRAAHRKYMEEKAGQVFQTEYPTVNVEGKKIWLHCRGVYKPEEGFFNSSVLDITERKRIEEELRVSEERYRLALSQSGKVFFFLDVPSRTMQLSEELAVTFGLPQTVDNMPDNFIAQGLVEPESEDSYRQFYERIFAGEAYGEAIISCHMRNKPEQVLWYKIAFTTIFDDAGLPSSSIITYEDINDQYQAELDAKWKQVNLFSVSEEQYTLMTYDLTKNLMLTQTGKLFSPINKFITSYDGINDFWIEHFIFEKNQEACRNFLDVARLTALFEAGIMEDHIEFRSLQNGSSFKWTSMTISLIEAPYSRHLMAQVMLTDIDKSKTGEMEIKHNIEKLKKELENSRIKVMINQMQPHFLYNALSAIQTIVKIDPDYAHQLIYDFTIHLRSSIKALSSDEPIPFEDELANIRAYLNIEKMRFGDKMNVVYEIGCDHFKVVPLSIQPLAENAARHGLYPKGKSGGTIWIRTREEKDSYIIEVEDDGEGFDVQSVLNQNSDSVGIKNLIFRLNSLMNANVTFQSKIGKGTLVSVMIPKE